MSARACGCLSVWVGEYTKCAGSEKKSPIQKEEDARLGKMISLRVPVLLKNLQKILHCRKVR